MKHALAIGVGVVTLAALPAFAADIPVRIPTKAPVMVAPVSNWSGCYIGANAGATWGRSDTTWTGITESPTGFAAGAATVIPAAANARFGNTGFVGGGQVGCNYQNGSLVLGVEADAQYTGLNVTRTAVSLGDTNGGPPTITPGNITENFQSRWLSTARARWPRRRPLAVLRHGRSRGRKREVLRSDLRAHRRDPGLRHRLHRHDKARLDRRRRHRMDVRVQLDREG